MGAGLRAVVFGLVLAGPVAAEVSGPAEVPPADYAGQQYVDSMGCLYLRTGPKGNETWTPRVTRDGVPLCNYPPSGQRVPVVEEESRAAPDAAPNASP